MRRRAAAARHFECGAEAVRRARSRAGARTARRDNPRRSRRRGDAPTRRTRSTRRTAAADDRRGRPGSRRSRVRPAPAACSASCIAPGSPAVRGSKKRARYGVCVGRGNRRGNGWTMIAVPPGAIGGMLRQSRSASPSARYAALTGFGSFARHERRRRRDPDHERVDRLGELDPLQHRALQQRLRVRDRRRPGVDGRRGLLARQPVEDPLPDARRGDLEDMADARVEHAARPRRSSCG